MDKNLYSNLIHLEKRATNHNTNVDYLLASKSTFYFVELKTDSNSFKKPSQLLYYAHYIDQPYADLYNFFKDNLAVDNQDPKWKDGLDYLQRTYKSSFSSDIESNLNNELKLIYLAPSKVEKLKEYQLFKKQLGEKLIFMSLKDFGSLIDDDDVLSDLLIEIDKIEIE